MGFYFNPQNEGFQQAAGSRIYVDKSMLIYEMNLMLNETKNCVALSHARRFGKSQAADMLEAYYSMGCDSRALFENLEIAKVDNWDKYLNKFNVIHLDITCFNKECLVEDIIENIYDELKKDFPDLNYSKSFNNVLSQVYAVSGAKFVIIIDEWDCVIRNQSDRQDVVHDYMQFLHEIFKGKESKKFLALGYVTGILPIKKIKDESALNNFREFTMMDSGKLGRYFGFTENEVKALCESYNMNLESVNKWYNGYLVNGNHMYNPNSVYQCMLDNMLKSYWRNTSAFETVNSFITLNFDGLKDDVLKMLAGYNVPVKINTFQNDLSIIRNKDEALTALIHLGYLAYDDRRKQAYIPNYEVKTAFFSAIEIGKWKDIATAISNADELLFNTIDGHADFVAEKLDKAHEAYTSILQYNNENSISCVLTMAYATAPAYYNIERELPAGKGFADIVFIPRKDSLDMPAILIELKFDKNADTAIKQIKEKRYAGKLEGYADKIILVGVNYDKDIKKHECIIEEYYGE